MAMRQDEAVVIDGKVEHATSKAYLVELETTGMQYWLPKSQVYFVGEPDEDGNREFHISQWIAGKNDLL